MLRPMQLSTKLNQLMKQRQGEREKLRLRQLSDNSEPSQEAEKRRWQDTQAKKRYIAHLCIYLIPLVIIFCFKSRKCDLETEPAKGSGGNKKLQQGTTMIETQTSHTLPLLIVNLHQYQQNDHTMQWRSHTYLA